MDTHKHFSSRDKCFKLVDVGKNSLSNKGKLPDDKPQLDSFSFGKATPMRLSGLMDGYIAFICEQKNLDYLLKEEFDAPYGKTWDSIFIFNIYMLSIMQYNYSMKEGKLKYSTLSYPSYSKSNLKTCLNAIKSIQQHKVEESAHDEVN